jgi:hypothetical protein
VAAMDWTGIARAALVLFLGWTCSAPDAVEIREWCPVLSVWIRAVTRPRLATYEDLLEEAEDPSLGGAVKAMLVAALVGGTVLGLAGLATGRITFRHLDWPMALAVIIYGFVVMVVAVVIGFLTNTAVLLAVSRALGGQGDLAAQAYLLSASMAPMLVLAPALVMVAGWDSILRWPVILYDRYLQLLGLRAAHKYGWGRGVIALVVLAVCYTVLGKCVAMALEPLR